jgi:Holliday junction resolvasome RuvABC DNA-binding subunit
MNGFELDKRMREILTAATRETSLSSTAALVELGFSPRLSWEMVEKVIIKKAKEKAKRS